MLQITMLRMLQIIIIDHILTNSFDSKIDARILKVDISDHFQPFPPPNQ